MRTITLEEHFVTASFIKATDRPGHKIHAAIAQLHPKLLDLGAGRIAAMDEAAIDFQVLSLASMGLEPLAADVAAPLIRDINDELAAAIKANPKRLGGFAALAMQDPKNAAKELDRCITRLKFCGVMLDGTTGGLFLDDPKFLPVWEAAAALRVPVYLHPALPPEQVREVYYSGLPGEIRLALSNSIMFSVDYPFSPNTNGRAFLDSLSGTLSAEDYAKLSYINAEKVLKLEASSRG